ncbi:hypothetical protein EJB05_18067, partial [Eragrostis curvula]
MESGDLLRRPGPSVSSDVADGRGGWRAALFLLAVVFLERVGFVGVQGNLIMYLTGPLGMSTAAAAASVNAWIGTVQVLPLVGALAADSRLGRYGAVLTAGVLYLLSLGILTISTTLHAPPHPHHAGPGRSLSSAGLAFFYIALYMVALAQGFHKPCAQALGADQFARASRSSYFNWYHFAVAWGYVVATVALSYVEDNVGWTVGFGASWAAMLLCLAVFLVGAPRYRVAQLAAGGAPFADAVRAWAARVFRGKNATDTERLLVAPQPGDDSGKGLVAKLLPIWLTSLVFAAVKSQLSTLFTKQASTMDRRIGAGVLVPPAALHCIMNITLIVMVPVYDRALVPLARRVTGHRSGLTTLRRIGAGMAVSGVAMAVAALVEARRLRVARDAGIVDSPDVAVPMSLWWLVPQYVLVGLAAVLGTIGLEEFFYSEVPDALRSVGLALSLSAMGAGSYVSGMLVSAIDWATTRSGGSWFNNNLNRAHLDYFYWLLAGFAAVDVAVFVHFANRFVYRNKGEH